MQLLHAALLIVQIQMLPSCAKLLTRRSRRRELYSYRTPEQRAHSDLRRRALYANRSPEQVAAQSTRRQATYTANAAHPRSQVDEANA